MPMHRWSRSTAERRAAALLFLMALAPCAARPLSFLVAEDFGGRHLRGFDLGDLEFGLPPPADFAAAKAAGANVVRVFFAVERSRDANGYTLTAANLSNLDRYIDEAERRDMWVVIAFHPPFADKEEKGELWRSAALQDSYVLALRQAAARYRDRAVIGGFDLLNEPVPPGGTFADRQRAWLRFADRIASAVRAVNPRVPLIVQPAPDALAVAFDTLVPLRLPNIVYSVHSYMPMALTHQFVMKGYDEPVRYGASGANPNEWNKDMLSASLEPVRRFAERYGLPIYVGEFSCVRWAANDSATRYVAESVAVFEAAGWSWTYHDFRGFTGWDAEIHSSDRDERVRSADAPVFNVLSNAMRNPPRAQGR